MTLQKLIDDLNELGSSDAIAEKFCGDGIKAGHGANCCPIAKHAEQNGLNDLWVMPTWIGRHYKAGVGYSEIVSFADTPCESFARRFTRGEFPELVKAPEARA